MLEFRLLALVDDEVGESDRDFLLLEERGNLGHESWEKRTTLPSTAYEDA